MKPSPALVYFMPGGGLRSIDRVPYDAELDRLECLIEEARLQDCSRSYEVLFTAHRYEKNGEWRSVSLNCGFG